MSEIFISTQPLYFFAADRADVVRQKSASFWRELAVNRRDFERLQREYCGGRCGPDLQRLLSAEKQKV